MEDTSRNKSNDSNLDLTKVEKKNCLSRKKLILFILLVLQLGALAYIYHRTSFSHVIVSLKDPITSRVRGKKGLVLHLPLSVPANMSDHYIEVEPKSWCLRIGSLRGKDGACDCNEGWQGFDCGVPPSVWDSDLLLKGMASCIKIERRSQPRRIIHSLVVNSSSPQHLYLLNHTIQEMNSLVEVFLIGIFGNETKLWTQTFEHSKVMIINLEEPHSTFAENQATLWSQAKKRLSDVRPDDLVLMSNLVTLPSTQLITFLKLYDGFGEPVFFNVQDSYGNDTSHQQCYPSPHMSLCTFGFLRSLCDYDARLIWSNGLPNYKIPCKNGKKKQGHWIAGSRDTSAGIRIHI